MQKKLTDLRIIFMGTPEFAVASLQALVEYGCTIVAVVTAPDKQAGRGLQLQQSAVKQYAISQHITVLQPFKLKDETFIQALQTLQADIQIVVAFRMLPVIVWSMPPLGTINVHGSLLPNYRGAAPIHWAVINGESQTGVTTFKLQHEIDTGNILDQQIIEIAPTDTTGIVHDKMMYVGATLLIKTLEKVATGTIIEIPQLQSIENKHAPKLHTETCAINWEQSSEIIYNFIRGLSPYPTAYTTLANKKFKIYFGEAEIIKHPNQAATVITDNKTYLKFATNNGYILCTDVQLEGKKRMQIADFLRGYKVPATT